MYRRDISFVNFPMKNLFQFEVKKSARCTRSNNSLNVFPFFLFIYRFCCDIHYPFLFVQYARLSQYFLIRKDLEIKNFRDTPREMEWNKDWEFENFYARLKLSHCEPQMLNPIRKKKSIGIDIVQQTKIAKCFVCASRAKLPEKTKNLFLLLVVL